MYAGGNIKHVLNCTGGSWHTRNYTVFIGCGSRTAFRGAYRDRDASLRTVRQWNHTMTSFTESILSMYFTIGWARFHEHEHAISSREERVRKCKPLPRTCSSNMRHTSVSKDKTLSYNDDFILKSCQDETRSRRDVLSTNPKIFHMPR